ERVAVAHADDAALQRGYELPVHLRGQLGAAEPYAVESGDQVRVAADQRLQHGRRRVDVVDAPVPEDVDDLVEEVCGVVGDVFQAAGSDEPFHPAGVHVDAIDQRGIQLGHLPDTVADQVWTGRGGLQPGAARLEPLCDERPPAPNSPVMDHVRGIEH